MNRPVSFDIFCRVIDNLGDAGVCWRLTRQLAGLGCAVRLWIDNRGALARIAPDVRPDECVQRWGNITVRSWPDSPVEVTPHNIVIEAFACTLPAWFIQRIPGQGCLWLNLEYLSAESWVESCHGLPSPQPGGQRKYFFFPGFTRRTGGLLREPELATQRRMRQHQDRRIRLRTLLGQSLGNLPEEARIIFLFCYPDAPLKGLVQALAKAPRTTLILAPAELASQLRPEGQVQVHHIPYVAQEDFDTLLECCDLNFVRGEDSLVRAIWAGRPMVWHIYKQSECTHLVKLRAWLERAALPAQAQALIHAWNQEGDLQMATALTAALAPEGWNAWQARSQEWAHELAEQPDLATQLLAFYEQHRQTR
ncbi:elongation factor P maturation arginine rhamnosyltransferase EarP [Alcaligenaceae bacterium CGII-47]|nr:elongation factor P maturation arginine rhamnosyltransferase EarP [Alcaligenaceae bacterium CGII-47]